MKDPNANKLSRRKLIGNVAKAAAAVKATNLFPHFSNAQVSGLTRSNILFIVIDDLNDWVEPLGGHPLIKTPNFTRLAKIARTFHRAYTTAPVCSPARAAAMFGLYPHHSGVYTLKELWEKNYILKERDSIPKFFLNEGYKTYGTGKIFHAKRDVINDGLDLEAWTHYELCNFGKNELCVGEDPVVSRLPEVPVQVTNAPFLFGQGRTSIPLNENGVPTSGFRYGPGYELRSTPDIKRARWMAEAILNKNHGSTPFFAALGIGKPHYPIVVPQDFFNLYKANEIQYPAGVLNRLKNTIGTNPDVQDLGRVAKFMISQQGAKHLEIFRSQQWRPIVHAYLAAVSCADYCLGLVLDSLLNGPNKGNTMIVLYSDHGWQLGEKLAWHKETLWERAVRVPMMIGGPGIIAGNSGMPVSSIDLYPTLTDLALNKIPDNLDGRSLKTHLTKGRLTQNSALTVHMWRTNTPDTQVIGTDLEGPHFSVRTTNYRYIRYKSGERELYNSTNDPWEFKNLLYKATDQEVVRLADRLDRYIPDPLDCKPRIGTSTDPAED